jgi:hypothetical protein
MKTSVSVSVADMLVLSYWYQYRQKYRLCEYICIGIGWTHIGPTLFPWDKFKINQKFVWMVPDY